MKNFTDFYVQLVLKYVISLPVLILSYRHLSGRKHFYTWLNATDLKIGRARVVIILGNNSNIFYIIMPKNSIYLLYVIYCYILLFFLFYVKMNIFD